jgi:hypothetical protein
MQLDKLLKSFYSTQLNNSSSNIKYKLGLVGLKNKFIINTTTINKNNNNNNNLNNNNN